MDLKFNSWSIYQTDFIANSGQRGITDHGSDGSLLLVPGSRYLWSSGDPWPHMLAAVFKVRRWFVQIRTRNSYNYRADWRLAEIRLWMPTQGWNFLLVSVCLLSVMCYVDMCYVDMLACCMCPCLHFPPPRQYHCLYDGCTVCCHRPLSPGLSLSVKL